MRKFSDRQTDRREWFYRTLSDWRRASNNSLSVSMYVEIYFIVNTACFKIPDLRTWNLVIQLSYRFFSKFSVLKMAVRYIFNSHILKTFSSVILRQLHLKLLDISILLDKIEETRWLSKSKSFNIFQNFSYFYFEKSTTYNKNVLTFVKSHCLKTVTSIND